MTNRSHSPAGALRRFQCARGLKDSPGVIHATAAPCVVDVSAAGVFVAVTPSNTDGVSLQSALLAPVFATMGARMWMGGWTPLSCVVVAEQCSECRSKRGAMA